MLQMRYGIIGKSPIMNEATQKLVQAAPTDLTILITGETGTGKEIFANAIHGLSNRKKAPFISVNCGAIPETLLESELFGHEKGAFTGAIDQRRGFFESADKGTIFLDEIGEMPVGTQVKLLRILESGEYARLGSSAIRKVDVRVIAATNRDLVYEVREGNFRQDLYFRLKSVQIELPPLRRHIEDIPLLVEFFAQKVSEKLSLKYDGITEDAVKILQGMNWAGNVRELRNLIETMITLEQATYITPDILRRHIAPALPPASRDPLASEVSMIPLREYAEPRNIELELIFRTLLEIKNDITDLKRYFITLNTRLEDLKDKIMMSEPMISINDDNEEGKIGEELMRLEDMEKKLITLALEKYNGNRRHAANSLGISERTLYRKLDDYGIEN
ncbi:MAG: sigma-54-dependent Fis family transcriptional regulator [Bacteroidetes bacterium]|nr:MAG: sigma-54-dependent Fis family transcriptional regulator [Bacteroidota bacterium]